MAIFSSCLQKEVSQTRKYLRSHCMRNEMLIADLDWKRTFSSYWKDYQAPFEELLKGFKIHAEHLDKFAKHQQTQNVQETSSQLTDHFLRYQEDREAFQRYLSKLEEERTDAQYSKVQQWLSNPGDDEETYQARWRNERDQFPGTASWILEDKQVEQWMDKDEPASSILWIYGKKGAGR